MMYFEKGSPQTELGAQDLQQALYQTFQKLGQKKRVLAIPPDYTRFYSYAGMLTQLTHEYFGSALTDVLPALGTHEPMSEAQIASMYGNIPRERFRVHDWRNDIVTLGEVPASYVKDISEGTVAYSWPAQVNRLLPGGKHDLILSIGQIVPHEVAGMANFNKNIFVGTGGVEGINKSHFLGAAYGMERIMGRANTPVRKVLNYASRNFAAHLPIVYVLTVVGKNEAGKLVVKGLYIGDDEECFEKAAALSLKVNFTMLPEPLQKVVVYLDPKEFKSTWLGNKSIYRTRMAIADGGELVVLAPGLERFGEDEAIDALIRKYGYVGRSQILEFTKKNDDLKQDLSASAHLIHGSSDNRFSITYCPGHLTRREIEQANFHYANPDTMLKKYDPAQMKDGWNTMKDGEEVYYISNPALGLWAHKDKFNA